jgi:hypothetical protein
MTWRMNAGRLVSEIVSSAPASTMVTAAMLSCFLSAAFPASAAAGNCLRQCHWRAVMGTCRTVSAAHVSCPFREKVCGAAICSQAIDWVN